MINHDRLVKLLLTTFFEDFVRTFLPEVASHIDFASVQFLDKETFTDILSGRKRVADLIARVKISGHETFIIVHVEHQSEPEPDFPSRMFMYFARFFEKHRLPVYPVVVFTHSSPRREEPSHPSLDVCGLSVLNVAYRAIQLNRMPWRQFLDRPNPVATALMTRMNIPKAERPKVKLECLRLPATLRLDPAKSRLIGAFIDTYLKLSAKETQVFERELESLYPVEREATMKVTTSWHEKGERDGKEALVGRQLERRFSTLPTAITEKLDKLTSRQLDQLGLDLFDLTSLEDLENWLDRQS